MSILSAIVRILTTILIIAGVLAASAFALYHFVPQAPVSNHLTGSESVLNEGDTYNLLFCGLDESGENTDTIMLIAFDAAEKKAKILSIPRDTMSNVDRTPQKINSAYSDGRPDNIQKTIKEVEMLTGLKIDRYAVSTFDAFAHIIDALGGVEMDVPKDMKYEDPYQDLVIDLKAGKQTLNGEQAVHFLRFRDTYLEGDLGRVKAQQLFYQALIDELTKPSNVTKLPEVAQAFERELTTDLSLPELLWFLKQGKGFNTSEGLEMFILPGSPSYIDDISYYIPSLESLLKMLNTEFFPDGRKITAEQLNLVPEAAITIADTGYGTGNDEIKHYEPGEVPQWREETGGTEPLYTPEPVAPTDGMQGYYGYGGAYAPPPEDNTGLSVRGYHTQTTTVPQSPPSPPPAFEPTIPVAEPIPQAEPVPVEE